MSACAGGLRLLFLFLLVVLCCSPLDRLLPSLFIELYRLFELLGYRHALICILGE